MKVTPQDPYFLIKKYVKPIVPGKLILSQEESYNNWGTLEEFPESWIGGKKGGIVQVKPYSKIPVDGSDDLFLVKIEDVIALIEE